MSETIYIGLANLVVAFHVGYVAFVVVGQLLIILGVIFGWSWVRNPWFRALHLLAILIVAAETAVNVTCPLTTWENSLRALGGQETLEGDFIGRMLHDTIFLQLDDTHWIFDVMYFGFAAVVVATFFLAPPKWGNAGGRKVYST